MFSHRWLENCNILECGFDLMASSVKRFRLTNYLIVGLEVGWLKWINADPAEAGRPCLITSTERCYVNPVDLF